MDQKIYIVDDNYVLNSVKKLTTLVPCKPKTYNYVRYITGISLGWKQMDSLFLGGMLCMSSTMIIIKIALNDWSS